MKCDLLFYVGNDLMHKTQCEFAYWANAEPIQFSPPLRHPTHVAVSLDGVTLGKTEICGLGPWSPGCTVNIPVGGIWIKKDQPDLVGRVRDKIADLECRGDFATADLLEECLMMIR